MKNQSDITPIGLRLQDEPKKYIKQAAKRNNRSINAELVSRIEASIQAEETFRAAESGNPSAMILAAIETIRSAINVAEKSVLKIGVENGDVSVAEDHGNYLVTKHSPKQSELIAAIEQLPEDKIDAIMALLKNSA